MSKPFVKNASDESQIQGAKIKVKLGKESEINDLKFLLSTDQGRRFIWKLISKCGVFRQSFTGNSQTFFMEGERNIGLFVLDSVMEADPEAYVKMYTQSKREGIE
jgi:hypothetical protein